MDDDDKIMLFPVDSSELVHTRQSIGWHIAPHCGECQEYEAESPGSLGGRCERYNISTLRVGMCRTGYEPKI